MALDLKEEQTYFGPGGKKLWKGSITQHKDSQYQHFLFHSLWKWHTLDPITIQAVKAAINDFFFLK